jgi:hypothetical protein
MGVIGAGIRLEVDGIRCGKSGRSMVELSEKGDCKEVGVSWMSVYWLSRRRLRRARAWSSSSSDSESYSISPALRARACEMPSSVEATDISVMGRPGGTSVSVVEEDRSVEVECELFGGLISEPFFLVMLRARTGPRVAVLLTELDEVEVLPMRGIWMRIP